MADAHLSSAELVAWRDAGTGDRDRIVTHLAACAACRHAAAELERERPAESARPERFQPEDFVAVGRRASATRPRLFDVPRPVVYLATAASLALAVLVVPAWLREPLDTSQRGDGAAVMPLSPKDTSLPAATVTFEWTANDTAGGLRLVVVALDDAGRPAIDREVIGTRYEPTSDERARLQSGRDYHWFVEYRGAGAGAGTSASARFRVE